MSEFLPGHDRESQSGSATAGSETVGGAGPLLETLGLFAVVALAQLVAGAAGAMTGLFVLSAPVTNDPWTVVTSVYAHGGLGHLLSNSLALVVFGWPVARATTRVRFHAFFVATGAVAGLAQIWVMGLFGAHAGVLGASGAVFALLGYLVAGNRLSSGIAAWVSVPRWVTVLVFLVLAAAVTVATAAPQVALVAHFVGFLLGLLAGRAGVLQPQ
ncbi:MULTISPECIES: rhomboid family intramembrane serine protease [Saliphagus]|uniref:Rhomboid family intramembrane serine protease n=1 Tax=Saliphagus infecundisoli TaxID=1849069 RepID=A0ABD5QF95_9EURY|nr:MULTISPECIES: rhomboid family intramembrane serine protease [Saliphagus]